LALAGEARAGGQRGGSINSSTHFQTYPSEICPWAYAQISPFIKADVFLVMSMGRMYVSSALVICVLPVFLNSKQPMKISENNALMSYVIEIQTRTKQKGKFICKYLSVN
jgi:hypothetical protein